jgi:hypothetical protein
MIDKRYIDKAFVKNDISFLIYYIKLLNQMIYRCLGNRHDIAYVIYVVRPG